MRSWLASVNIIVVDPYIILGHRVFFLELAVAFACASYLLLLLLLHCWSGLVVYYVYDLCIRLWLLFLLIIIIIPLIWHLFLGRSIFRCWGDGKLYVVNDSTTTAAPLPSSSTPRSVCVICDDRCRCFGLFQLALWSACRCPWPDPVAKASKEQTCILVDSQRAWHNWIWKIRLVNVAISLRPESCATLKLVGIDLGLIHNFLQLLRWLGWSALLLSILIMIVIDEHWCKRRWMSLLPTGSWCWHNLPKLPPTPIFLHSSLIHHSSLLFLRCPMPDPVVKVLKVPIYISVACLRIWRSPNWRRFSLSTAA